MRRSLSMSAPAQQAGYEVLSSRTSNKPGFRRKTWLLRGVGLCVLIGAVLATSLTLGRQDNLHKVLLWIHEHTAWGLVIFGLLYVWFTVMFLPPALLAACAGALYGFLLAIPIVWVCAIVGETVSFLLGRFLLRKWVAELTADWPMWAALNAALREDGWKLVMLLRLSPAMPFSVINYALGSSSLPFSHYFWPSVLGIVPGLIIYVWLGSLAADVTEAVAGGGMSTPPAAKITVIVICAVSALIVVVLSAIYTKRAIDRRLACINVQEEVQVEEQHYLLSSEDVPHFGAAATTGAPAGLEEGSAHHAVMISVETPRLVVRRSSSSGDTNKLHSQQQQPLQQPLQHQQQQQQQLHTATNGASSSWSLRVAQSLGLSTGGNSSKPKLKAAEDVEAEPSHNGACSNSSSGVSKAARLNRDSR